MNRIRSSLPWVSKNVVRIVRLQGMITAESRPGGQGFNFQKVEKHIEDAFDVKKIKPKAVCLEINSRGGSAVQSNLIYQRIRALSKGNNVPVLSFAEDTAASGGYWLALAGDEIFVDPNSVIGSIGALFGTFGMEETIKKLGLEWRVLTAGENKFRNDPFKPVKQQDVDFQQNILDQIHRNFINVVKERRPTLDVKHKTVFTGDYFLGEDAVSIGLADGICSDMKALCRKRFGEDVKFERYPKGFLSGLKNFQSGVRVEVSMNDALEELAVKQHGF